MSGYYGIQIRPQDQKRARKLYLDFIRWKGILKAKNNEDAIRKLFHIAESQGYGKGRTWKNWAEG